MWRPSASREILQQRARLLQQIRGFMDERDILEVETPVLSTAGNTDPHIHSLTTEAGGTAVNRHTRYYLHTSPEFAMKRLLASGSGPVYQIARVFRNDETGRLHQPEFTMLEWYRPGFDHHRLMDELAELVVMLDLGHCKRYRYEEVFENHLASNPHTATTEELAGKARERGLEMDGRDRGLLLDFLFSHSVGPHLGLTQPEVVYDYPLCQAALAKLSNTTPQVAERFELFIAGMEIANGFNELQDVQEQRQRFVAENERRRLVGLPEVCIDEEFLAALEQGLPECAGVAVGVDRLLMILTQSSEINDVLNFPHG